MLEVAYQRTARALLSELGVDFDIGVRAHEVEERRKRYGSNIFVEDTGKNPLAIFFERFKDILFVILVMAAAVSFALGRAAEAVIIGLALLVDAGLSFLHMWRAEKTMRQLQNFTQPTATALRDGRHVMLPASELVVGDIIELQSGQRVPADVRVLRSEGLRINESVLTGESDDVEKHTHRFMVRLPLADRKNMAYVGTSVAVGSGTGIVVACGTRTEFGKIGQLLKVEVSPPSPLRRKLQRASAYMGAGVVLVTSVIVAVGVAFGERVRDIALTAVTLALSAIPEDLTMILTVVLTVGVGRILRHGGAVRVLESSEGLGAATVICTDKTGTLTEGSMQADELNFMQGTRLQPGYGGQALVKREPAAALACTAMSLASDAHAQGRGVFKSYAGTPTERAALIFVESLGVSQELLKEQWRQRGSIAFHPQWKYRASLHDHPVKPEQYIFAAGAPDILLRQSTHAFNRSFKLRVITASARYSLEREISTMAASGHRLVGVVSRKVHGLNSLNHTDVRDMVFMGVLSIGETLRAEVPAMVQAALDANIGVKIVTGDHPGTAKAVAQKIGVAGSSILTSDEMTLMSDAELEEAAERVSVFARITPLDKQRIIKALQRRGHVVAMTGDGVNDAVALKAADIGVAMGSGKDIAKQAADLILLDDRFGTIVAAIREGRVIRDNLRKVIAFLLSTNSAEVAIFAASLMAGLPLPLLPAQILWVNLVTDGTADVALSLEAAERDVMSRLPEDPRAPIIGMRLLAHIMYVGFCITAGMLLLYWYLWYFADRDLVYIRTMLFSFISVASLLSVWSFRSLRDRIRVSRLSENRWILASLAVSGGLQLAAVYSPILQPVFMTVPLRLFDWVIIVVTAMLCVIVIDLRKYVFNKLWEESRAISGLRERTSLAVI